MLVLIIHIEKQAVCQRDYKFQSFLSIQHVYGDLCTKHLGIIDSSTDQEGRSEFF